MSRSLSVLVLLPMDEYNSFDTYREDDRLKQIYYGAPKMDKYFKTLKIRSAYTSYKDLEQYFRKKYHLGEEEYKNHSISYDGGEYIYHFKNGLTIRLTNEEDEKLKREHIDEGVYCRPYKCLYADIYGSVTADLLTDTFTVVDDKLIDRAVELIGCRNYADNTSGEIESERENSEDKSFEIDLDYEGDMDGKLLVGLIVGKYMAERVNGIAVAEYD